MSESLSVRGTVLSSSPCTVAEASALLQQFLKSEAIPGSGLVRGYLKSVAGSLDELVSSRPAVKQKEERSGEDGGDNHLNTDAQEHEAVVAVDVPPTKLDTERTPNGDKESHLEGLEGEVDLRKEHKKSKKKRKAKDTDAELAATNERAVRKEVDSEAQGIAVDSDAIKAGDVHKESLEAKSDRHGKKSSHSKRKRAAVDSQERNHDPTDGSLTGAKDGVVGTASDAINGVTGTSFQTADGIGNLEQEKSVTPKISRSKKKDDSTHTEKGIEDAAKESHRKKKKRRLDG